ncbi:MAG: hypothetical protein P9M13_08205 [Candidatus Ancaeobacter aquaticus]|nr:hypothetical protein [Candidatus Ancaeobacter aquaticus]
MRKILSAAIITLFLSIAINNSLAVAEGVMEGIGDGAVVVAEQSNNCMGKLSRGVSNVALGWAEIPKLALRKEGPMEGLERAATRTGGGFVDVMTFVLPPYDEEYIEPEYFSP